MAKRPGAPAESDPNQGADPASKRALTRSDKLATLLDRCTSARADADVLGEKLLSYLLGMAIEETRNAIRRVNDPSVKGGGPPVDNLAS